MRLLNVCFIWMTVLLCFSAEAFDGGRNLVLDPDFRKLKNLPNSFSLLLYRQLT